MVEVVTCLNFAIVVRFW